eukprot:3978664-Pyramimonas_sp.AAC.1
MEVAAAFCRRALRAHGMLKRGLQIVLSKKDVHEASEQLRKARESGTADSDALSKANHTVIGGKIAAFLESGDAAKAFD